MTYHDLFLQGPRFYIPALALSLLLTLAAYSTFPLLFARVRRKPISAGKYKAICYGFNILIVIFSIAVNGKNSGVPYLLWTWVFVSVGLKILKKRKVLTVPYVPVTVPAKDASEKRNSGMTNKAKRRYCKFCGGLIEPVTKKCSNCGKQYFHFKLMKGFLLWTLVVSLAAGLAVSVSRNYRYQQQNHQLQTQVDALNGQLEAALQAAREAENRHSTQDSDYKAVLQERNRLQWDNKELKKELKVFTDNVVFVSEHEKTYHRRGNCIYLVPLWCNVSKIDEIQGRGLSPCSYCCN